MLATALLALSVGTKFLCSKTRNRLTKSKDGIPKRCYSSIRLKNLSEFDEAAQADEEFMRYWEMSDFVDPGGQTIAPTIRTMVVDIQEKTSRAYTEDWEKALLSISEATGSTARFILSTKNKVWPCGTAKRTSGAPWFISNGRVKNPWYPLRQQIRLPFGV
jgi:hypothetical protein